MKDYAPCGRVILRWVLFFVAETVEISNLLKDIGEISNLCDFLK